MSASLRHDVRWTHALGTTCDGRFICEHLDHWELRCGQCDELFTASQSVSAERQLCPARDERGLLATLERMQRSGVISSYCVEANDAQVIVVRVVPRAWAPWVNLDIGFEL